MVLFSAPLLEIVLLSVRVSLFAMLFVLPLATAVAYLLATRKFPGWHLLNAICHLPLVMPPVITGYLLLLAFSPKGWIGGPLQSLGISFAFNWLGAALAAGIMAFPLVMRPIRLAFEVQEKELLESAKTLGANRWSAFFAVSMPLAMPGIIAGGVLGFAKALGEFGATITFVSNIPGETQTMALAIYSFLQSPDGDSAAITLVLIGIAISFVAILISEIISDRISTGRRNNRSD
ncbi:MAG: molybdate ABC transporter permease subunit [Pseudomonadota bacterium]